MDNLTKKLSQKKYLFLIFLIISLATVAIVNWHPGIAYGAGDYAYHINRIKALATSISHFNFLPKVDSYFAFGYGYASSLFYPDIFLYPSAILTLLGVPTILTYWLTQALVNFVTLWLTFVAGKRLHFATKNNWIFTLVYFFATYRLQVLFSRQDIGELMGMAFFPLVLSELIRFKKGETKQWYVLALAMTGIGLSHIISLFMMICFAAIFVIFNLKHFLDKTKLLNICKAALLTIGMTLAVSAPIIEQLLSQKFHLSAKPLIFIYQQTLPVKKLFWSSLTNQPFIEQAGTVNVGLVIIVGLLIYTVYNLIKRKNLSLTLIAWILFIACTRYFPWYQLRNTPFASFQFPWRFFSVISLIVAYLIANDDLKLFQRKFVTSILMVVMVILSVGLGQMSLKTTSYAMQKYDNFDKISTFDVGFGREYLPSKADLDALGGIVRELNYDRKKVAISDVKINENIVKFHFDTKNQSAKITAPLIFYKGYQARVSGSGSATTPKLSNNGLTNFSVSGSGTAVVQYHYTMVQKISLTVSLLSGSACLIFAYKQKER